MKIIHVLTAFLGLTLITTTFSAGEPAAKPEKPAATPPPKNGEPAKHVYPKFGTIARNDPALDALLAPDAAIEKLAEGFTWSEGPIWVKNGNYLLFSDVPRNVVFKWKEGIGTREYLIPSGYTGSIPRAGEPGSNGLTLDPNGNLVLCQHGDRRVARLEKNGKQTVLAEFYEWRRGQSGIWVACRLLP